MTIGRQCMDQYSILVDVLDSVSKIFFFLGGRGHDMVGSVDIESLCG